MLRFLKYFSIRELEMAITKDQVEHVANLARLNFNEQEKERFTIQLNSILNYINKLQQLDTKQVKPTFHALAQTNVFREDQVKPSIAQEVAMNNGPDKERGFYRVPKIIE
jgi:aspartyl-tRNA(Asn)/glutamyl-tRNA(Gln) amidotransferase subunit C